jgi:hypothetical protein
MSVQWTVGRRPKEGLHLSQNQRSGRSKADARRLRLRLTVAPPLFPLFGLIYSVYDFQNIILILGGI